MIIDFHTHCFPDKIAERSINTLEKTIFEISGEGYKAYLDGTLGALKNSMKQNNIDYSVVLPIATTVTQSTTINNVANEINGKNNIFSFGSVHPMQENWEEELERIAGMGLLGIKLHPEYQSIYIDSDECMRVLKKAEKLGLLVVLHTGHDVGVRPPVHCLPDRLKKAISALANGGSNIIAAHMGGWRAWDEVYKYIAGTPVMLDTSYTLGVIEDELFLKICEKHGADRILFGSDSPWQEQGEAVRKIRNIGLSDIELDKIFCKNAQKLLKIN